MRTYTVNRKIRFGHIDALGVAFYPRLIEMLNDTIESFFEEIVGYSYKEMHIMNNNGVPTVKLEVDFKQSVYLEDTLTWELTVAKINRSSFTFNVIAKTGNVLNLTSSLTLVYVEGSQNNISSKAIPENMRSALLAYLH